jgi:signal transduction histidine kinase
MRSEIRAAVAPRVSVAAGHVGHLLASASRFLPEIAFALFCVVNLAWLGFWYDVALPVHLMFICLSIVFGLRMWTVRSSLLVLLAISLPTFLLIVRAISIGKDSREELLEVPLMVSLFLIMVWHVRKRQLAAEHEHAIFGNASHELLTPLTIARGEVELLARRGPDSLTGEELTATCGVVLEELQRSEVLASGLLALSRLDGSSPSERHLVSTDDLLDAAVERWARVTSRPIVIEARAGGELLCVRRDIGHLLDNLIENALRHAPGISHVTLVARAHGRRFVLEVSDQGKGIPEDALPYIFDRFYRARSSDGTRGGGLGLAIVKAIAQAHHGKVFAESTIGVGTTFRVELPGYEAEAGERLLPVFA